MRCHLFLLCALASGLAGLNARAADQSATAAESIGATVPYVRYEAEAGTCSGAAVVVGPNRSIGDLGGEASGRKAVKLTAPGDAIEWPVTEEANSIVVRCSIPDSADGKGLDATLSVYVNETKRGTLALTSRYAWLYGPEGDPKNTPSLGGPRHIYDESHRLLDFTIKKGDRLVLKKDAGDNAAYYGIDLVELEMVAPPAPCPPDFVNVSDEGITPANFGEKIGQLLLDFAKNERYKGKKGIYIPAGRYKMEAIAMVHAPGLELRGAGMWHTVLYDDRGKDADWGTPGFNLNGMAACFSDFAIFGSGNTRTGSGKPFNNAYGDGSVMRNLWIEHMSSAFWVGGISGVTNRLTIDRCRLRNLGGDGINLCNGTKNSTVVNTTVRSSGDDGIAIWSAPEYDGPAGGIEYRGCANNVLKNCTVELPWRANAYAIYGGKDNTIKDCIARDTLTYAGVNVSSTFKPRPFEGETRVENVLIERCGGTFWGGQQFGAVWVMADDLKIPNVIFKNIRIVEPTFSGIMLKSETYNKSSLAEMRATFENVTLLKPGTQGVFVQDAIGSADFKNTKLLDLPAQSVQRNKDTNGKKGTGTIAFTTDSECSGIQE